MVDDKQIRFLKSCLKNGSEENSYTKEAIKWWIDRYEEIERIQELQKNSGMRAGG